MRDPRRPRRHGRIWETRVLMMRRVSLRGYPWGDGKTPIVVVGVVWRVKLRTTHDHHEDKGWIVGTDIFHFVGEWLTLVLLGKGIIIIFYYTSRQKLVVVIRFCGLWTIGDFQFSIRQVCCRCWLSECVDLFCSWILCLECMLFTGYIGTPPTPKKSSRPLEGGQKCRPSKRLSERPSQSRDGRLVATRPNVDEKCQKSIQWSKYTEPNNRPSWSFAGDGFQGSH